MNTIESIGLVNAPAVFQALVNRITGKMRLGDVLVYLDDVIIPSSTPDEGLDGFLKILEEISLVLRMDKCKYFRLQRIDSWYYREKISAIKNNKTP